MAWKLWHSQLFVSVLPDNAGKPGMQSDEPKEMDRSFWTRRRILLEKEDLLAEKRHQHWGHFDVQWRFWTLRIVWKSLLFYLLFVGWFVGCVFRDKMKFDYASWNGNDSFDKILNRCNFARTLLLTPLVSWVTINPRMIFLRGVPLTFFSLRSVWALYPVFHYLNWKFGHESESRVSRKTSTNGNASATSTDTTIDYSTVKVQFEDFKSSIGWH